LTFVPMSLLARMSLLCAVYHMPPVWAVVVVVVVIEGCAVVAGGVVVTMGGVVGFGVTITGAGCCEAGGAPGCGAVV
jgi:hypothetical protein